MSVRISRYSSHLSEYWAVNGTYSSHHGRCHNGHDITTREGSVNGTKLAEKNHVTCMASANSAWQLLCQYHTFGP
jgi:hypothetical protein